ncbi:hypothetical protein BLNAU_14227 [Blattamonas nauphoetae]|uniref:Uncharacterized protein n=1 Tax=Blattamonas nauphoetae TaxID=2049346 RepID=A0ABQ9XGK0_9EUKA|nr:hypothetical protein BLNAU_14227 [Blattamonas nauphoetae]
MLISLPFASINLQADVAAFHSEMILLKDQQLNQSHASSIQTHNLNNLRPLKTKAAEVKTPTTSVTLVLGRYSSLFMSISLIIR